MSMKRILRDARARYLPRPLKTLFRIVFGEIPSKSVSALETFAMSGEWHTVEYASRVGNLELWEIDPAHEPALNKAFRPRPSE